MLLVEEVTIVVLLCMGRYLAEELPEPSEDESTLGFDVDMP